MKKYKILVMLLALSLSVVMGACSKNTNTSSEPQASSSQSQTVSSVSSQVETSLSSEEPVGSSISSEESPASSEEASKEPTLSAVGDLSSDPMSFQFQLDGVLYTLPVSYSQFADNGWVGEGFDTAEIRPNSKSMGDIVKKDTETITLYVTNTGTENTTYAKALVSKIMLDDFNAKNGAELVFPGGIKIGSTETDVVAAYGEPKSTTEAGSQKSFYYESSTYSSVKITIDTASGVVKTLAMENIE